MVEVSFSTNMLLTLLAVGAALFGGTGVLRLDDAKNRAAKAERDYERLLAEIASEADKRNVRLGELSEIARKAIRANSFAQQLLDPIGVSLDASVRITGPTFGNGRELALSSSRGLATSFHAASSAATGAMVAGTLWLGTQAIGISSTGLPIVFLHGAALHNATLAALGGGSLVTGGGGMVAGGAVLASCAIVPAGIFLGLKTHSEANRINREAEKIETANETNLKLLTVESDVNKRLGDAVTVLEPEAMKFSEAVKIARGQLRRFGWFSHLYRAARARWWGTYYIESDEGHLDVLASAVAHFTEVLSVQRSAFNRAS